MKQKKNYSDKLSEFICNCNEVSGGLIIDRLKEIYDYIYIDEVQDLVGYDWDFIKLLFESNINVCLVGDPRQSTYQTHATRKKVDHIKQNLDKAINGKIPYEYDDQLLSVSHRNNGDICRLSNSIFPLMAKSYPCNCKECREFQTDHEGIYYIYESEVSEYLNRYKSIQLIWDSKKLCSPITSFYNYGASKGLTFDRVLIYPTKPIEEWLGDNNSNLKNVTRSKLYVAVTRARRSVTFVVDKKFSPDDKLKIKKYNI